MSWLARSLVNSLRGNEEDEHEPRKKEDSDERYHKSSTAEGEEEQRPIEPGTPTRGVKEDLSELTKTLTRQLWGVASFLAPPPAESSPTDRVRPSDPSDPTVSGGLDEEEVADSPRLAGIRSDFAEIGGRFKTGISILSKTKAVSEISKIASNFLPFGSDEVEEDEDEGGEFEKNGGGAIGVTDEVLAFARNISMHPETWLDFPLIPDDEDSDEFDMSDAQQEHALTVERLAPRLSALRIELCPSHMSESRFWKIYFVLLYSRLNRHDAELLTTPQIVQARAMLLQDLQNRTKPNSEGSRRGVSLRKEEVTLVPSEEDAILPSNNPSLTSSAKTLTLEEPTTSIPITDLETEKHPVQTTEVKIIDKSVVEEHPLVQAKSRNIHSDASDMIPIQRYEEDGDDWLEEETGEVGGSGGTAIPMGNEEDVSFSDLEEDDDQVEPKNYETSTPAIVPQPKDSRGGWVQLNKSSEGAAKGGNSTSPQNKESNDWLSVDDLDVE